MVQRIPGQHWLAGQWGLWSFDALAGRLPGLGFQRWATTFNNCVHACQGEAWGSHWQWGDLRLAPWGCWLQDDCLAWVYLAQQDRFFCMESWSLDPNVIAIQSEISTECGLQYFAPAALASEHRRAGHQDRWSYLEELCRTKVIVPQAGRQWQIQIGSHFLPECEWHLKGSLELPSETGFR